MGSFPVRRTHQTNPHVAMPRNKDITAAKAKADGRASRAALGSLQQRLFSNTAKKRYLTAVWWFHCFLSSHKYSLAANYQTLDRQTLLIKRGRSHILLGFLHQYESHNGKRKVVRYAHNQVLPYRWCGWADFSLPLLHSARKAHADVEGNVVVRLSVLTLNWPARTFVPFALLLGASHRCLSIELHPLFYECVAVNYCFQEFYPPFGRVSYRYFMDASILGNTAVMRPRGSQS
jgi:hypothetical protein